MRIVSLVKRNGVTHSFLIKEERLCMGAESLGGWDAWGKRSRNCGDEELRCMWQNYGEQGKNLPENWKDKKIKEKTA